MKESGKKTEHKGSESIFTLVVQHSKAAGKTINSKAMVNKYGQMELSTKVNTRTVKSMAKVNLNGLTTPLIKDSSLTTILMDLESISGKMGGFTKEQ